MALNIPNTDSGIKALMSGVDTGSSMYARAMQPILDREKLKQQQDEFVQNLALQKQAEGRAQSLMPYMIQQYQDTHNTAANEAAIKGIYRSLIQDALTGSTGGNGISGGATGLPIPPMAPGLPNPAMGGNLPQMGASPNVTVSVPQPPPMVPPPVNAVPVAPLTTGMPNTQQPVQTGQGEYELRPGNPRLSKLDMIAGLVPGVPKPVQHITGGMIFTTYPSGRMTAQKISGQGGQTAGEKNVSAREASKLRDQATALANSANLVNQGYGLLDNNPDLTGPGNNFISGHIPFTGMNFNFSSNPELGKFTTVAGKLQAELGKYASSRGGIQAVNWAGSVKPSITNTRDYNYGMFEGIEKNLKDDYATLNTQYKAATGQDLPIPLPPIIRKQKTGSSSKSNSEGKKVKKVWKLVDGELV